MRTLNSYGVCFKSLQHGDDEESFQYLDQPSIVPANLLRLVKRALALGVKAAEVFLYVGNVALEIRTEQIGIFSNVFGPLRQEGPFRRGAGVCDLANRRERHNKTKQTVSKCTKHAQGKTPLPLQIYGFVR